MTFNFNEWRNKYNSYSFEDHKKIYNKLEKLFPEQVCFTLQYVEKFISNIPKPKIVELGGHRGELASCILQSNDKILLWDNYEISSNAIKNTICKDKRYNPILLEDFAWNLDIFESYNTCILSHVIEHIKQKQLRRFFNRLINVKYIYIEAPLHRRRNAWNGRRATHILECDWTSIREMLKDYKETTPVRYVRFYIK